MTTDVMTIASRERALLHAACALLMAIPLATPAMASAQSTSPATARSAAPHGEVFTSGDAVTVAASVLASLAAMPLDRHIAVASQSPSLQNNAALRHTTTAFRILGEPGSIVIGGATYIYGRVGSSPRAAELGLRTVESIGAADVVSFLIKGVAGRARPFVVADTNPRDYRLGRGFGDDDHSSFPSGHATTAFAAASAVSQELSYLWPHASHVWTPVVFASASMVGVARIYEDKHWASDVIAGAAVGILASRIVVGYARAHPRNAVDRLLLPRSGPARASRAPAMSFSWRYQW